MSVAVSIPTVGGLPVAADNPMPVEGPATDQQLRAAPLAVSGPATNAELRAAPLPMLAKGSTGTNASANQPSLATITGSNVLLGTIAANANRGAVVIQNQAASDVIVVGDPGGSDSDIWTWLLTGVGAGKQGAELPPELGRFRGRLRVYGPTGSRVAIVEV